MKSKIILFLLLLLANVVRANDGRFYISGNHLVPISDADIRIDKEILTIRIADDGFAYVDVDYTFNNLAGAKNVRMGFEAAIENDWANVLTKKNDAKMIGHKGHPNIFDFVVEINGKPIGYQNRFAFYQEDDTEKPLDYEHFPVDKEWVHGDFNEEYYKKFEGWDSGLYNAKIDSSRHYAHVYYFEAPFKSGINKVHHTYRYEMGNGLDNTFDVRYWLTPALRWAGNKIGDFTLRISAEGTAKHFFIYKNKCFEGVDFKLVKGVGKMRSRVNSYMRDKIEKSDVVEVSLRNGVIEWHKTDFHPTENLIICSADKVKAWKKCMASWANITIVAVCFLICCGILMKHQQRGSRGLFIICHTQIVVMYSRMRNSRLSLKSNGGICLTLHGKLPLMTLPSLNKDC